MAMRAALVSCLAMLAAPLTTHAQPYQVLEFRISQQIAVSVGDAVGPKSLTLADVDQDGQVDIIAIDQEDDAVWVLRGLGDGTFEVPEDPIDLDVTPTAVVIADIASPDGGPPDGKPDIFVTASDGDVGEILLNEGGGSFTTDGTQDLTDLIDDSANTVSVVAGNFDAASATDLALLDLSDEDVSRVFFLCNSAGNLIPCSTFQVDTNGTGPVDLGVGDLDGDGHLDVVALNQTTATFAPMYGDGNGGFTENPRTFPAQADPSNGANIPDALAVGALTDDAFDDLVIVNAETFTDLSTLVALSEGRDRFSRNAETGPFSDVTSVALGDINGDAFPDAGLGYVPPQQVTTIGPAFLIGDGTGGFIDSLAAVRFVGGVPGAGLAIALGDLDHDQLADFVQISADGEHITAALNISNQVPPTATSTASPTVTPTHTTTATVTATVTITSTPTATPVRVLEDDGCAIGEPSSGGRATEAVLGFVVLAFLALRRRVRT